MPLLDGGAKITNYIIEKRESTRKAFATAVTKCPTTSMRIGELCEGCEYYFRVSAENEYGIGEAVETSDPVRASQAPSPPESIVPIDITKTSVSLAWTKPKHDGGSRITGYVLEAQKKGTDQWAHVNTVKSMDFIVKNLNESEEYIFRVMAVNHSGRSLPRETKHIVVRDSTSLPEFDLRGVCQKTVIAKAGDDIKVEIPVMGRPRPTISWQKDGAALKLTQRTNVEATAATVIISINECNRGDSGVYTMTAKNIVGSVADNIFVRVHDVPGPPKGPVNIVEISRTFCVFSWEPPENDGGVPITNYVVEIRNTTSQTWNELSTNVIRTMYKAIRLNTGSEYQFRVKAKNRYGTGPPITSEAKVAAYPFKVPGPPGTPNVVAYTKDSITIGWNEPVSDGGNEVIGYHVERKERSGIVWYKVSKAIVKGNIFRSSGLEDGVAYEFRVMAENMAGIGKPSKASEPILALDPVDPPGQPVPTFVNKNNITIQWTKPEYDGGFKITGYTVEKRELPAGRWSRANFTNIIETSFTVSGLTQDTAYEFRVIARNSAGAVSLPSDPSDPTTCKDDIIVPRIMVDAIFKDVVLLKAGELVWTVVHPKVENIFLKVNKLLEGNEYIFRVHAVNQFGVGGPLESDAVTINDPYMLPGSPRNIEVSNIKKESMVLSWESPSEDGGSPVTGYIIEKHDKEGVRWTRCNRQTVTDLTFKVSGLMEGHSYEFRVAAENNVGIGEPSSATVLYKALDPVFKPGPPHNPRVTDTTKSSVFLSWGKPVCNGGCEIQGYIVESDAPVAEAPAEQWTICTPPSGIKKTKFEITNLKENQAYKFRICAINKIGVGEHADVFGTVVTKDRTEEPDLDIDPELRKIVTINAGTTLRLFIPIRGRPTPAIKWVKDEAPLKETAQLETTSSYTSLVIDKMSRNDSGKYTITAENSSGTMSAGVVVRVLDTPSAPTNLKIKEITNQSVTFEWQPPLLDGGSKIKNYIIEKRESTRKTYAAVVTNCHALSWKIEPLQEGCSYYFRVLAENAHGVGLPTATVDPLKVSEVPQTPKSLMVTDQTKTSISLAWEKPEYDGGSRVLQYLLEVQLKGQEKWNNVNTFKTMEATVSNLNPGEEYLFRVTAINDKGKSEPKVLAGPVMAKDLVFEPDVRPQFSCYSVHVGKDMDINIPIFGRPKPAVTWTKDGAPLKFTTRVNINNTPTHTTLSIKEAATDDGGMYVSPFQNAQYDFRVIAKNAVGTVSKPSYNSGPITASDNTEAPKFSIDPAFSKTIIINAGETFTLDADVRGKPLPTIKWFKNEKPFENTLRQEIRNTETHAMIVIKDSIRIDSGVYTLQLTNEAGTETVPFKVIVL
uniref:Titin n=1 Tax=Gouania willdenowi TaxID=441366 RepID=A0A8C5DUF6_GOUWI